MATYQSNDDSVVVVIGSGAGGGTLANELCQKGIKVVLLEAGKRESPESSSTTNGVRSGNSHGWTSARPRVPGRWRETSPVFRRGSARP